MYILCADAYLINHGGPPIVDLQVFRGFSESFIEWLNASWNRGGTRKIKVIDSIGGSELLYGLMSLDGDMLACTYSLRNRVVLRCIKGRYAPYSWQVVEDAP